MAARKAMNRSMQAQVQATPAQGGEERLTGMLEVNVTKAEEVDQKLQEAIEVVTRTAAHHHLGVLVTRTGVGRYTVRAHPSVPYGLIRQQHE
jgi:hypothetical protein